LVLETPMPQMLSPAGAGLALRKLLALLCCGGNLLLPGALLVAVQAQLLASFVFVDFGFSTFFERSHSVIDFQCRLLLSLI
jgi:hypothetical protein